MVGLRCSFADLVEGFVDSAFLVWFADSVGVGFGCQDLVGHGLGVGGLVVGAWLRVVWVVFVRGW